MLMASPHLCIKHRIITVPLGRQNIPTVSTSARVRAALGHGSLRLRAARLKSFVSEAAQKAGLCLKRSSQADAQLKQ